MELRPADAEDPIKDHLAIEYKLSVSNPHYPYYPLSFLTFAGSQSYFSYFRG